MSLKYDVYLNPIPYVDIRGAKLYQVYVEVQTLEATGAIIVQLLQSYALDMVLFVS
jgi:hypothetical protein